MSLPDLPKTVPHPATEFVDQQRRITAAWHRLILNMAKATLGLDGKAATTEGQIAQALADIALLEADVADHEGRITDLEGAPNPFPYRIVAGRISTNGAGGSSIASGSIGISSVSIGGAGNAVLTISFNFTATTIHTFLVSPDRATQLAKLHPGADVSAGSAAVSIRMDDQLAFESLANTVSAVHVFGLFT